MRAVFPTDCLTSVKSSSTHRRLDLLFAFVRVPRLNPWELLEDVREERDDSEGASCRRNVACGTTIPHFVNTMPVSG